MHLNAPVLTTSFFKFTLQFSQGNVSFKLQSFQTGYSTSRELPTHLQNVIFNVKSRFDTNSHN